MADNLMDEIPPEIKYAQPGATDHEAPKSWFTAHHILAYVLFGLLGLAIVAGTLYFQSAKLIPKYQVPFHQTKTTDPMADWKTYTNEKYGFQLKHPSGMVVNNNAMVIINNSDGVSFWNEHTWEVFKGGGIVIHPDLRLTFFPSTSLNQAWITNNLGASLTLTDEVENIASNSWNVLKCSGLCGGEKYVLHTPENVIVISLSSNLAIQILSTLKFTSSTLPGEISASTTFKSWIDEKVKAYDWDSTSFSEAKTSTLNIDQVQSKLITCADPGNKLISSPGKVRSACIYSGVEPDSYLYILNHKTGKTSTIKICGTICTFENGFWLDDANFVFLETDLDMDYADNRFDIYTFSVYKYDFTKFETTNWSSTLKLQR